MQEAAQPARVVRFGPFEADFYTRELRKRGIRIKLQDQPFQVLAMLLERPGELVTREEIRAKLWPQDTFVDFDHGLNAAVRRLRDALNDSADTPRYIETLPRRGYRFMAAIESPVPSTAVSSVEETPAQPPAAMATSAPQKFQRRAWFAAAAVMIVALAAALIWRLWLPQPAIDSIAILPLVNDTNDPRLDYLSDGITDAIINNLGQVPTLKVASRNAAFVYKNHTLDPREIARELGTRAVLIGSMHPVATSPATSGELGDIRLEMELVDTETNRRLWGERYTVKRLESNAVQAEISDRVSEKLSLRLTPGMRQKIGRRHTENNEAFDSYLRGRFAIDSRKGNDPYREALGHFQEAVDLDPNYALAFTGEAAAYGLLAFYGGMSPAEAFPKEEIVVQRALQLDPDLTDAHIQRGYLLQTFHRDLEHAEVEFRQAIKLQPYSGSAHHALALQLAIVGRVDESIAEARRAAELEPSLPPSMGTILWTEYFGHRFTDMADLLRSFPRKEYSSCMQALVDEAAGNYDQAVKEIEQVRWFAENLCSLPHVYAVAGQGEAARKILNGLIAERTKKYISAYQIALVYAGLRDSEKMLQWLDSADRESDPWMLYLKQDPRFDGYRDMPEFATIEKRTFTPR